VSSFPQSENGIVTEVYGFARDITEERRAEQERESLTRDLQLLLESTLEGIFTIGPDGHCTMVNAAAARLLGHDATALIGAPLSALLGGSGGSGQAEQLIRSVLSLGQPQTVASATFPRSDGAPIPVAYSAAPIWQDEEVVGAVITFTDLSERRKLEARLEQANRLSGLGRLAATVAHEFNNVLMGIAPFVDVIRRKPSPEKMDVALRHIGDSVKRGRRITQDILRFTQPAEPVFATVELGRWLDSLGSETKSLVSPACQLEIKAEPLMIRADQAQLHQVFLNLILNARDAMGEGGSISISANREPPSTSFTYGAISHPERFAHIAITDTGCGMSPETVQYAFEPLFTTKKSGTGLGLPVAQQIVQRHGGQIFIESTLGVGTTFHLFLPLERAVLAAEDPATSRQTRPSTRGSRNVLLVEDDSTVAAGIRSLLEFEGFSVTQAGSGAEALACAEEGRPDLVLLDVGLPDMEGRVVFENLRARHIDLPVIFSTGHADRLHLEDLLLRPNVGYLLKPYDADTLMNTIAEIVPNVED
ncbi:MAG TPA: ATP-binding protein, partial [Thermoanaerobaculia bacterium]